MGATGARRRFAAVALAVAGTVAGCGETAAEPDPDAELTVYVSLPLRGPLGADGRDAADGARLALADADHEAAGISIRARFLDDTAADALPNPVQAAANARAAAEDSTAIAYLGELNSGATRASLPVTNEARLLQVSPGAGATDLVAEFEGSDELPPAQPSGERSFGRVIPSDVAQAEAGAAWADRLRWRRVAIRTDRTAFAETLANAFDAEASERGITIASGRGAHEYLAGTPDSHARRAIASDVFLSPPSRPPPAGVLVTSAALDPLQLPAAGRELADHFASDYGRGPGRYAAYGYEAMAVVLDSLARAAEPLDREAVIASFLATEERESVLGTYSIDEVGETTLSRMTGYELDPKAARVRPVATLDPGP